MASNSSKKYVIDNEELMKAWDWDKNNEIGMYPDKLTCGSGQKAWWICNKGHEWEAQIGHRNRGSGCPYCYGRNPNNKKYIINNEKLIKEWNWDKNNELGLNPEELTCGIRKRAWWVCDKGHEWEAIIESRNRGSGCPYCAGQKVWAGYNDLETTNPEIAKQWHPTKNNNLTARDVTFGSSKKVWWICEKGHEWEAIVASRNNGTGCPRCDKRKHTSFVEQAIYFYCKKVTTAINRYTRFGKEIDIYLPEYNIGIEYNGSYWHKNKEKKDKEKVIYFADKNIRIITVKESNKNYANGDIIEHNRCDEKSIYFIMKNVFDLINIKTCDMNIDKDKQKIFEQYINNEEKNSLAIKYPEYAKEWNYEKNGNLLPSMFSYGSGEKVWWKCDKGHEWEAVIASRSQGYGCPYCANQKIWTGYNDLATTNPELAKQWHTTKNNNLTARDVSACYLKKVWWKCDKGHEWESTVVSRNQGYGCPYCAGQKVWAGYNDLATTNPELAKQWHPIKNGELTPKDVTSGSGKKVWWVCDKGHEWEAKICSRNKGGKCPYCSNQKALAGYNDLATTNPELAKQWHTTKNGELTPKDVMSNSGKKVWWVCDKGHEWESQISSRNKGHGCPLCGLIKMSNKHNKKVICVETGVIYNSQKEAEKKTGALSSVISAVCNGKKKTAGGYHWEFVEG